jgi:SAM-dependent methyltransferase
MKHLLQDPDAWSEIAGSYDRSARDRLTPFSREAIAWAALTAEDDVVDVACGPGTTTVLAAERARSVTCVDFSAGMIEELRRNTAQSDNVTAMVGDGMDLPLPDAGFTAAFSMFGLMFFPDPIAGLKELHRVLAPGGQVFIGSWPPLPQSPMMRPFMAAVRHAMPPPPDAPAREGFPFDTADALAEGLRAGGFVDVEVRPVVPRFEIASAESYWDKMKDNLFATDIRKRTGPAWPVLEAKILDHLRGTLADVKQLEMPAWVGRGVRP